MSQFAVGGSEALMGQSPCSTFAKSLLRGTTEREDAWRSNKCDDLYVIAVEASPQWQLVLYSLTATESVTPKSHRAG